MDLDGEEASNLNCVLFPDKHEESDPVCLFSACAVLNETLAGSAGETNTRGSLFVSVG